MLTMCRCLLVFTCLVPATSQMVLDVPLPELAGHYTSGSYREATVDLGQAPLDVQAAWLSIQGWGTPGVYRGDGVECSAEYVLSVPPRLWAQLPPGQLSSWWGSSPDLLGTFQLNLSFVPHWGADWSVLEDGSALLRLASNDLVSTCLLEELSPIAWVDSVCLHVQVADTAVPESQRQPRFFLGEPWPNPANGQVHVRWMLPPQTGGSLSLIDMRGARLRQWTLHAESAQDLALDVDELPSGLYVLRLEANGWQTARTLVVGK